MNEIISIILAILSSLCASFGNIELKLGSMKLEKNLKSFLKNYSLIKGLFFCGISTILFIFALKYNELTNLYPIASLNYVFVSLLSIKFLNEKMNRYQWLGIILIMGGIYLIVTQIWN